MRRKLIITAIVLTAILGLLSSCADDLRYMGPCQVPGAISVEDLAGEWSIVYDGFLSADSYDTTSITGVETLVVNANGTYTQTFQSEEYVYESPVNSWDLVTDSGEGVKMAMHGLRYFAAGLENANGPLDLGPQTVDRLRYKRLREETGIESRISVVYPVDEVVYLYPRRCIGKLVLLQMTSRAGDPDDLTVHNPPFTRRG